MKTNSVSVVRTIRFRALNLCSLVLLIFISQFSYSASHIDTFEYLQLNTSRINIDGDEVALYRSSGEVVATGSFIDEGAYGKVFNIKLENATYSLLQYEMSLCKEGHPQKE
jgi:hypothetical protein